MNQQGSIIPRENFNPQYLVSERATLHAIIWRIRYLAVSRVDIFALRLLILN